MEKTVFLDIETIPSQSDEVREFFRDEVKAPGNIKKPESIEAWLAENRDAAAAEALAKTSFDPALGHICTIGWAIDDEDPVTAHAYEVEQEADILRAFFASFHSFHRLTFVGHNVGAFDLRFILCRAVVLGVKVPASLPRDPKPWDKTIFDTMLAWAGTRGTVSMDKLCQALALPGKDGFDGSMVAEAWANGEHERIAEYCADDVRKTREVWKRFEAVGLAA
ncbi:3'-5' exonuclease [Roseovarius sp. SK2]|uniref:3'-5' exonuclease n=1 Tax=Roseovarius TaxID=74030 RepID=UPI00237A7527|nr:3'-5' exonuclease [Roseovarius sp. SK2]MDD9726103.1 3'-5' exonuclease [Roseovarius sp. SK2]